LYYKMDYVGKMMVKRVDPEAITPFKTHETDAGYDLTAIKIHKVISKKIIMFDTGIQIQVPKGYYTEIVPRSSLVKTGWMLANSVGIIDNTYTGNIFVVLIKVDDTMPDIELPFRGFQLLIRKQFHLEIEECENIVETERGDGGFGSTN
jgi:dUTP pyrophosphatase